jgi:hypothetical protein
MIFVFGSNLRGAHGAGAARVASRQHGAVYGKGVGHYGNSYALPTKDFNIRTLSLAEVKRHIDDFITYAAAHPDLEFQVTRVGCGLAGFKDKIIAPMFVDAPANCLFDTEWRSYLGDDRRYWGSV